MKLRRCRPRISSTSGLSVGPSAPEFQERLWLSPSAPPSPLASLCLSLYETRSLRESSSWAVTKFTLAEGWRPSSS